MAELDIRILKTWRRNRAGSISMAAYRILDVFAWQSAAHNAYTSLGFEIIGEFGIVLLSEGMTLDA